LIVDGDAGAGLEVCPRVDEAVGLNLDDGARDRNLLALEGAVGLVVGAVGVRGVWRLVSNTPGETHRHDCCCGHGQEYPAVQR
jgi:hypothetical protein